MNNCHNKINCMQCKMLSQVLSLCKFQGIFSFTVFPSVQAPANVLITRNFLSTVFSSVQAPADVLITRPAQRSAVSQGRGDSYYCFKVISIAPLLASLEIVSSLYPRQPCYYLQVVQSILLEFVCYSIEFVLQIT